MKMTKYILVLVILALAGVGCASSTGAGPCTPGSGATRASSDDLERLSNEELARRVMELTGAADLGKQVVEAMAEQMKDMPGLPPTFMDRVVASLRPEDLTEIVVRIWVEELDRDSLIAIVQFYETPAGKAVVRKQPIITHRAMEAGAEWGRAVAEKVLSEMGYRR